MSRPTSMPPAPAEDRTWLTGPLLWLDRTYARLWHGLRQRGAEHVPDSGPVILASNHTTAIDPILIQAACPRRVRWVMLTSYQVRLLGPVWRAMRPIGLDRDERDRGKLRQIIAALREGDVVGLFPEGGLQREQRELKPLQPGIVMIAQRSGAPIVPVWVSGTPRRRQMIWHFLQPSRASVTFGEPFHVERGASNDAVLAALRERMLALQGGR